MNAPADTIERPPLEHAPSLDALEEAVDRVHRECARLLELASLELARRQDAEAELVDGWTPNAQMLATRTAYRLRCIARQLTRAQCVLVHPDDDRHGAARQVFAWVDEAERDDAPWRLAGYRRAAIEATRQ